jgi:hypothetical protein
MNCSTGEAYTFCYFQGHARCAATSVLMSHSRYCRDNCDCYYDGPCHPLCEASENKEPELDATPSEKEMEEAKAAGAS